MADYHRAVQFGLFPSPDANQLDDIFGLADIADRGGLELLGIQDHPYQARHLEAWALMATLLARTERVHVFPDVANLPLRPPAVLAKAAASLDVISRGRFELGLGAGAFWTAIAAMGGPHHSPREAAGSLTEAIEVIRLMWSDQRAVRYSGEHYRLDGAHAGPEPAHSIGIWLGVGGPRMLDLVGRAADGWVPSNAYFPPDALPAMHERIDAAAHAAGRDPAGIRRVYNVFGTITEGPTRGAFDGPADQWTDILTELVLDGGMDTFVFGAAGDDLAQARRFADEVAPAVREHVRQGR